MYNENRQTSPIAERKARWNAFRALDPKVKRMHLVTFEKDAPVQPKLWPSKGAERVDWIEAYYNFMSEQAQWLDDDRIPYLNFLTGTEIFAEAFGCKIYRPLDNMPFALPAVQNAREAAALKVPDLFNSPLALQFELAEKVIARTGKNMPLRLPDVQSPMDIAALIWEKSDFYIAMIEDPEAVKELAAKVCVLLTSFFDEWFRRYGTKYIAHYPPYYMEGGLTLSEDEIGAINTDMYDKFFLPELSYLSEHYGGLGIHCCANSEHQWNGFLKIPNLRFLNLIQPAPTIQKAYPVFHGRTPQWHYYSTITAPFNAMERQFPDTHIVLEANANTKDEALRLAYDMKSLK